MHYIHLTHTYALMHSYDKINDFKYIILRLVDAGFSF